MDLPWHWTMAIMISQRVQGIVANAGYDVERIVAPKELWFDDEALEHWYEERRELMQQHAGR